MSTPILALPVLESVLCRRDLAPPLPQRVLLTREILSRALPGWEADIWDPTRPEHVLALVAAMVQLGSCLSCSADDESGLWECSWIVLGNRHTWVSKCLPLALFGAAWDTIAGQGMVPEL